jgi:16S rRNA (adenine1518-N6/adenine1519-N6)-dimethyltransferase
MSLVSQTKEICQKFNLRPSRKYGQNFLIEQNTLAKIIRLAEIRPSDLVLEIGTGLGFLTKALASQAGFVITVESDKNFFSFLENDFQGLANVELIKGDILNPKTQERLWEILADKNYKVVANLPYQITSALLRFFLTSVQPPQQLILMVQKEVAKRLTAQPPQINLLALSVNFYAQVKILSYFSRHNFWPRPKVDSALIKLKVKSQKSKVTAEEDKLFRLIKIGFSRKRKKLINNLASDLKIEKGKLARTFSQLGWKENIRAENLSLEDWMKLLEKILDIKR